MNNTAVEERRKIVLEELYCRYNTRAYVEPDPIQFLYRYDDLRDREIVGLISSSLAYGRVSQIIKAVKAVIDTMYLSPYRFIRDESDSSLSDRFSRFRYRFTSGRELAALLHGIKRAIEKWGSLRRCFSVGMDDHDDTVEAALCRFSESLGEDGCSDARNSLLPRPERGSACKRLNLFLRWMVRRDDVDPGGWDEVPTSKLIIPLDTHMHRICLACEITNRKQADMPTALEITRFFRGLYPDDPVRYDFPLSRLGIRDDTDVKAFLQAWGRMGQFYNLFQEDMSL